MNEQTMEIWYRNRIMDLASKFLRAPSQVSEAELLLVLRSYRQQKQSLDIVMDEHEQVMNFR